VGFLPTSSVRHGESIFPTLGWCRLVMKAGDSGLPSSSLDDGVRGPQCSSGDGESTKGDNGLRRSSLDSQGGSRRQGGAQQR
jgi:hypothetical protein